MHKVLVIQTAFIGDAILGTALLEKLHREQPNAQIDYLVRDGNQSLFQDHPFLTNVLVWRKQDSKYAELFRLFKEIRNGKYSVVYNIQRYAASGILTALSGAKTTVGYKSNPLSFAFTKSIKHRFGKGYETVHEVDRVADLFAENSPRINPRVYPSKADFESVSEFKKAPYVTIAPASVWFTKQLPLHKWVDLINQIPEGIEIHLIGADSDKTLAKEIVSKSDRSVSDLTGRLKLLQTAALMRDAVMNYANDSAPVHLASAVNAPMCEVFCSTVPEFGFTPLSDNSKIVEASEKPSCKPCGIHGKSSCPKQHFNCANSVNVQDLLSALE